MALFSAGCTYENRNVRTVYQTTLSRMGIMTLKSLSGPPPPHPLGSHSAILSHLLKSKVGALKSTLFLNISPLFCTYLWIHQLLFMWFLLCCQICLTSLCDTLRLLGCFSSQQYLDEYDETTAAREENTFHNLFTSNILEPRLDRDFNVAVHWNMLCAVSLDCRGSSQWASGTLTLLVKRDSLLES